MGKITEQELKSISDLRQETTKVIYELGELEYQKTTLESFISESKLKVKDIKVKEAQILNELKEKYGNVSINIETGEF
jgi:hypothetical protein